MLEVVLVSLVLVEKGHLFDCRDVTVFVVQAIFFCKLCDTIFNLLEGGRCGNLLRIIESFGSDRQKLFDGGCMTLGGSFRLLKVAPIA